MPHHVWYGQYLSASIKGSLGGDEHNGVFKTATGVCGAHPLPLTLESPDTHCDVHLKLYISLVFGFPFCRQGNRCSEGLVCPECSESRQTPAPIYKLAPRLHWDCVYKLAPRSHWDCVLSAPEASLSAYVSLLHGLDHWKRLLGVCSGPGC